MRNPRHKYGAVKCERNGIKFPSKLERSCYDVLQTAREQGYILFFLRQIRFDLPGGIKHVVDFQIFTKEHVVFVEAKGRDLPQGKMKRQQTEELYNIPINVVRNALEIWKILDE